MDSQVVNNNNTFDFYSAFLSTQRSLLYICKFAQVTVASL